MSNQLVFNNTNLTVINRNNQIWFTSAELARALKYSSSKSITNLYNANSDEFSSGMTEVINSVTPRNLKRSIRIFSLRAAHLIAMFANTEVAKDFRRWLLDLADKEVGNTVSITPVQPDKSYRYDIEVTITDNLFNKGVKFKTKATSANAMVTGFARTLGFKISRMSLTSEPFADVAIK